MMKKTLLYPICALLILATFWLTPVSAARLFSKTESGANYEEDHTSHATIGDLWRCSELYFGSQKPNGSAVTEAEFEQFVDDVITPRFPDGLTLLTGYGQFRNAANVIVEEQSFVLILLYPLDDKTASSEIEEIRTAYKKQFDQESVLRVDSLQRVSF